MGGISHPYGIVKADRRTPPIVSSSIGRSQHLCSFKANMEPFRPILPLKTSSKGRPYIVASFKLAMRLSDTELSAQTIFQHGTQTFRGVAETVAVSQR